MTADTKIIIADRSWIVRVGLAHALLEIAPRGVEVVMADFRTFRLGLTGHAEATFVLVEDAMLADDEEPFALVRRLAPKAAIGVLVGEADRESVLKAIYFGAVAIIQKSAVEEVVTASLRSLLAGQVAFPRDLLAEGPSRPPVEHDERLADEDSLTPREREVIGHIGVGKTVSRIAADLKLSPHTVRVHVTHIMKKLDLRDRASLIHYAVKSGAGDRHNGGAPLSFT